MTPKAHPSRWRGIGPARPDRVAFVPRNSRARPGQPTGRAPARTDPPIAGKRGECQRCGVVDDVKRNHLVPHRNSDGKRCAGGRPAWTERVRHQCPTCGTTAGVGARVSDEHTTPGGASCGGAAVLVGSGREYKTPIVRTAPKPKKATKPKPKTKAERRAEKEQARAAKVTEGETQGPRIRSRAELEGRYRNPEEPPRAPVPEPAPAPTWTPPPAREKRPAPFPKHLRNPFRR